MQAILGKVKATIARHQLINDAGTGVLVAISGGSDSVALAYILKELGYRIGLLHANFGLRPEADSEEEFLKELAGKFGVPLFVRKFDTKGMVDASNESTQMVARRLRYDFMEEILTNENYAYCATAHHASDNAETIAMHFLKGSSPEILKGIPVKRGKFIRPLIDLSKAEIEEYCEDNGIGFRVDASNEDTKYIRNRIRHELAPGFRRINPDWETQLVKRLSAYNLQVDFIRKHSKKFEESFVKKSEDRIEITLEEVFGQELMLSFLMAEWGFHGSEIERALPLIEASVGSRVEIGERICIRERDKLLVIFPEDLRSNGEVVTIDSFEDGKKMVEVGGRMVELQIEEGRGILDKDRAEDLHWLDVTKLAWPLKLRSWEEGDRMQPLGMSGSKKLSDIFVDEKFGSEEKAKAVVVLDAGEVVCVSGFRIAEKVKLDKQTKKALRLSFH